jgi:hypothetical protein
MSAALDKLMSAARAFDDFSVDPQELRQVIDLLEGKFCKLVFAGKQRGEHLLSGRTPVSWVANSCSLSPSSASDRLCVGEQLEAMPKVAQALSSGEIGYQSASIICHFRDKLGERRQLCSEEQWIGHAREYTVKDLRWLAEHVRYVLDPEGFDHDIEEDYEQRFLKLSEMRGMYHLSGVLDREAGAALESALSALCRPRGQEDQRSPKQRRADALTEIVYHALDQGRLPRRHGVRPHLNVNTTPAGLKAEVGAPASELPGGLPISSKTVQRLACDGTLCRVLQADSVVIDVGRATRSVSPAQWRALKARHKTCGAPGCDRPVSWTNPHHLEFWSKGGSSNLPNLLPLCFYHHRLVHEGGWQVVRAASGFKFLPPEHLSGGGVKRRWGEKRWAA